MYSAFSLSLLRHDLITILLSTLNIRDLTCSLCSSHSPFAPQGELHSPRRLLLVVISILQLHSIGKIL